MNPVLRKLLRKIRGILTSSCVPTVETGVQLCVEIDEILAHDARTGPRSQADEYEVTFRIEPDGTANVDWGDLEGFKATDLKHFQARVETEWMNWAPDLLDAIAGEEPRMRDCEALHKANGEG